MAEYQSAWGGSASIGAKIIERVAKPPGSNIASQPEWRFERGVKSVDGGSLSRALSQFRLEPECLKAAEPECSELSERGSGPRCPIDGVALKVCSHDEYLAVRLLAHSSRGRALPTAWRAT